MPANHPYRQTIYVFLVCAVIVAATAIYVRRQYPAQITSESEGNAGAVVVNGIMKQTATSPILTDTDWQKTFTDSGVNQRFVASSTSKNTRTAEKLTPMDRFSRNFFSQFMNLQQNGLTNDSSAVENSFNSLVSSYAPSTKPKSYDEHVIIVKPTSDVASLRAYGNAIGSIMQTYAPTKDDASIALAGLNNQDPNYLSEISAHLQNYRQIIKNLISTPVPASLASYHLGLINSVSSFEFTATSLVNSQKDPLSALLSLSSYDKAIVLLGQSFSGIRSALLTANVTYATGDGGSYFNLSNI